MSGLPRWHNLLAIVATFFAAGAIWPWSSLNRILCAITAFALLLILLLFRMRAHARLIPGNRASIQEMHSRIDRIREDRERRYGRR